MLEHGADPNLAPSDPGSVLDMAAEIGTVAAVDLLLQHGAKLENSTPLHNAASMGPHGAARLSRVLPSEYLAIVGDRIPMMKYLLECGVDVNGSDEVNGSAVVVGQYRAGRPIHHAINAVAVDNVGFLLEHGADPHMKNQNGSTAFDLAKGTSMEEILETFSLSQ